MRRSLYGLGAVALSISVLPLLGLFTGQGEAGAASTTGSHPFTVMAIADLSGIDALGGSSSAQQTVPAIAGGLQGIKGAKVITCDTQSTSTGALTCEHNAVADHVAAVALFSLAVSDQSILNQAGIPTIGTTDTTSPTSFGLESYSGLYAGIGIGLAKEGCKRLGILYLDGTEVLANAIVAGAKWQSVTLASIPLNAPDLTPSIAKLAEAKVQCIALSAYPATVVQAMIAIRQDDLKVKMAMAGGLLTTQQLNSVGSQANGVIGVDSAPILTNEPVFAVIKKDMKVVNPKVKATAAAILPWAAAKLIADAAQTIKGNITPASLLKAMNGLRSASTDGALPPFSAIQLPNPAYKRYFNHYVIDYVVENGQWKKSTNYFDVASGLGKTSGL